MRLNPIYKKDELISARGYTIPLILFSFNAILTILVMASLFNITASAQATGEIAYASFLNTYYIAAVAELVFILLASPLIAISSIQNEKDQNTLKLLLTTQQRPKDLVIGKLIGVLSAVGILEISTVPVFMTVFIFGGVSKITIGIVILTYLISTVFASMAGITAGIISKGTALTSTAALTMEIPVYVAAIVLFIFRENLQLTVTSIMIMTSAMLIALTIIMFFVSVHMLLPNKRNKK